MNLSEKHELALKKFVDKQKKNPNVIGIIVFGSFVHSKPDKNSDLDVFVVLKDSEYREKGNTWINGVEVEYFINPLKQIYFEFEQGGNAGITGINAFANSKILYKKGNELEKLISFAKKLVKEKRPELTNFQKEMKKYHIDDMKKDLEDVYLKKDLFAFNQVSNKLLDFCLEIFCEINRIYPEKPKRLKEQLKKIDKKFEKLYSSALLEKDNNNKKFKEVNKLVSYTEKLLGGSRPKEWKIKSKCPYLENEKNET